MTVASVSPKRDQTKIADCAEPRYVRRRRGRGFQYLDHKGKPVKSAKLLKQFKALAIPPMWEDVKIAGDANAKVQAFGRDSKKRKQYIYCEAWQNARQDEKFRQLSEFAETLPSIRTACRKLLQTTEPSKQRLLATLTLILDDTGIRVGNDRYTHQNKTHGLTTLKTKHFIDESNTATFEFVGKGNKHRVVRISDETLVSHIQDFSECPGYSLFRYKDKDGAWQDICSEDVNAFIKKIGRESFTAKDFRTWNGTCLAVKAYHEIGPKLSESRTKPINQILKRVSQQLGNTPAICKKYYVHPTVLSLIDEGAIRLNQGLAKEDANDRSLFSKLETSTLRLLKNSQ